MAVIPPLPTLNSNDWYAYATAIDATARTVVQAIGSPSSLITDPAYPRTPGVVVGYWFMATGVDPANAINGDLIYHP